MKNLKTLAAVAALSLAFPLQAFAAGAIAVDDEKQGDVAYSSVSGKTSTQEAGSAALAGCLGESGHTSCRIAARFERCGAFAASTRFSNAGTGATKAEAIRNAMSKCRDCEVLVAQCESSSNIVMTGAAR